MYIIFSSVKPEHIRCGTGHDANLDLDLQSLLKVKLGKVRCCLVDGSTEVLPLVTIISPLNQGI